ncbi:MAG: hypothetical protein WBL58_06735 [Peptococcia bacterium]
MTTTTIVKIGYGKDMFYVRLVEKSNIDGILNGVSHVREYTPKGKLKEVVF